MLLSEIQNTALSGLEAFIVSERQCSKLDGAIAKVARICMRGAATKKDANGEVVSNISNLEVLRFWKIGSSSTELSIRRIKWLQQMALHLSEHRLVFNSIFGDTKGEIRLGLSPCTTGLRINVQDGASPWAVCPQVP